MPLLRWLITKLNVSSSPVVWTYVKRVPNLNVIDFVLVSRLLTLNGVHTLFWCFHCWLWTSKCRLWNLKVQSNIQSNMFCHMYMFMCMYIYICDIWVCIYIYIYVYYMNLGSYVYDCSVMNSSGIKWQYKTVYPNDLYLPPTMITSK